MTSEEISRRLRDVLVEQFGVSDAELGSETSLREDLGADSLDLIELVLGLEEEFRIELSDRDATAIHTVGEAARLVKAHL